MFQSNIDQTNSTKEDYTDGFILPKLERKNIHPLNIAHIVKVKSYKISQIHVLLKSGR